MSDIDSSADFPSFHEEIYLKGKIITVRVIIVASIYIFKTGPTSLQGHSSCDHTSVWCVVTLGIQVLLFPLEHILRCLIETDLPILIIGFEACQIFLNCFNNFV